MDKEKKLKIIWSVVAAVLTVATVLMFVFGIRAAVLRKRSSDFAMDTSGIQVATVYGNDGYWAVGTQDGTVLCYSEDDTSEPLFSYNRNGVDVKLLAISNGRLYAAFGNREICAFSLGSTDNTPVAVYTVGFVPERMFFYDESEYFAVYGVNSAYKGVYFLPKDGTGNVSYRSYPYMDRNTGLGDGVIGIAMRGTDVYFSTEIATVKYVNIGGGAIRESDVTEVYNATGNLLALAPSDDGYVAIDRDATVYNFDSDFKFIKTKSTSNVGTLTTVFATDGMFVCKEKNGGITGVKPNGGVAFSIETGGNALIVYTSHDSFAYLTDDGGSFKYYTLDDAKKAMLYNNIYVPLIVVGAVVMLIAAYAYLSVFETTRDAVNGFFKKVGKALFKHKFAYISLIPTFALLAIFYWYPIVTSLFMAFFDYLPGERLAFVGFENFKMVFMNTQYWVSFKNTLIFLVTDLLKALLPPIIFAECLLALRSTRTSYVIRVLLFIPGILPGVASMLVWADGIFGSSASGLLNGFLSAVSPSWVSKAWLMDNRTALVSLIFMNFPWVGSYLIFFGAISGINKEIYEAAKLDGCGWLRRIVKIDIPLIVPQIKYIFIQTFIGSVQNYTLILITTGGDYGTNTPALMMYYATAVQKNYGVASAMGLILLLFLMVATIINFKMQLGEGDKKRRKTKAEAV